MALRPRSLLPLLIPEGTPRVIRLGRQPAAAQLPHRPQPPSERQRACCCAGNEHCFPGAVASRTEKAATLGSRTTTLGVSLYGFRAAPAGQVHGVPAVVPVMEAAFPALRQAGWRGRPRLGVKLPEPEGLEPFSRQRLVSYRTSAGCPSRRAASHRGRQGSRRRPDQAHLRLPDLLPGPALPRGGAAACLPLRRE